jgi:transcription factor 1
MARLATFEKIFDEGLFPHQKRVKPGEPDAQRLNDSLLVTGSLLWSPRLPGFNFDSMSKQVILQYAEQAWKNTHLHACGPVRSLLWMPANDARSVVPRSESSRGKYDFYLDTLGNNTEVVTQEHMPRTPGRGGLGRQPQAEIESVIHAVRRGKEHGFELPPHRREHIHDFADDVARMTNGTGRLDALGVQQYLEEQEQKGKSTVGINPERLIEHLQTQKALNEGVPKGSRQRSLSNRNATETQAQMLLRQAVGSVQRTRVKVDQLANLGEDIYLLECEILGLAEGAEKEKQLARLETLQDEFDAGLKKTQKVYRGSVLAAVDDRLAIRSPVPRLSWDSRPYEPLIAKPEEAWPAMGISLIDSTPRPLPSGKSPDWYDWVQDFATALMSKTEQPLLGALENLQHGAGDLITKAPSLTDPKRGGRLSMTQLRVRMLTVDMLEELCQAYRDWPFRHPDANHTRYFRLKQVQGGSS